MDGGSGILLVIPTVQLHDPGPMKVVQVTNQDEISNLVLTATASQLIPCTIIVQFLSSNFMDFSNDN